MNHFSAFSREGSLPSTRFQQNVCSFAWSAKHAISYQALQMVACAWILDWLLQNHVGQLFGHTDA